MSNPSDEQSYHYLSIALHMGTVVVKDFIGEMWTHLFRKRQRRKVYVSSMIYIYVSAMIYILLKSIISKYLLDFL